MVNLIITPPILSAIEAIPPTGRKDLNLNLPDTESLALGNPITHEQIIQLSRYFRGKSSSSCGSQNADGDKNANVHVDRSLNALLRGTKLYIPPPPPKPEPSPEYLAHKARLLAAYEEDAYSRMLHNPSSTSHTTSHQTPNINLNPFPSQNSKLAALHDRHSSQEDPNYKDPLTPSLVLNIFLSVLITGFAVYWALSSFSTPDILNTITGTGKGRGTVLSGGPGVSEPVRVLLSLFAAIGVGIAEVAIYAIYLGKIESARGREKKIKERKEVVGPVEAGDDEDGDQANVRVSENEADKDNDKEVIWGRGPNGGLRRRMREKWEENEMTKNKEDGDEDEKNR
ncbi:endoplasmic reticulum-based factor for assembly of V-ATPase-domain-containing protein [Aspergillus oleicola]